MLALLSNKYFYLALVEVAMSLACAFILWKTHDWATNFMFALFGLTSVVYVAVYGMIALGVHSPLHAAIAFEHLVVQIAIIFKLLQLLQQHRQPQPLAQPVRSSKPVRRMVL